MGRTGRTGVFAAIIVVIALGIALTRVTGTVHWTGTDSLFYQAQSLEVRGYTPEHARQVVIDGRPGQVELRHDRVESPPIARQIASASWRNYSARFYRRRWVVPAMTAAINPLFGERSLVIVSAAGYVLCGLLLFILLARRFADELSAVVTVGFLLAPPVRRYLLEGGTDSWGLALLLLALLLGGIALERGGPALVGWILTLAVLSVTREDGIVAVVAALAVAAVRRGHRAVGMAVGGLLVTLPAGLLLGASLTTSLAYVENGFNPPRDTSLSTVLDHYPGVLRSTLSGDLNYESQSGWLHPSSLVWHLALVVFLVAVVVLLRHGAGDPYFQLMRGALLGAILFILVSVNYTGLRLELVFTPAVAVGICLLAERLLTRFGRWPRGAPASRRAPVAPGAGSAAI